MTEEDTNSFVDITVGSNNVRVEGSEDFISQELSTILQSLNLDRQQPVESEIEEKGADDDTEQVDLGMESTIDGDSPSSEFDNSRGNINPQLEKVARRINVDPDDLANHFYIQSGEVHIQNPLEIEPKYALLGYCIIREVLDDVTHHDNLETKRKLIDKEKVNIEQWGGVLLHKLRQSGSIKDDPNSTKSQNKPFKITPKGQEKLVDWLNDDD